VNEEVIGPFLKATIKVSTTMAFMEVVANNPHIKKGGDAKGGLTGIIGPTGQIEASGANHSVTHIAESPTGAVPFETETGSFTVEVCLKD